MAASSERDYINNKLFLEELTLYKKSVFDAKEAELEKPKVPEYAGECILKIAQNIARRVNFYKYTFKEDMIGDGVINCLLYIDNFDPAKSSNPYGYFSRIIWFAFLRRIESESTETYVKFKALQESALYSEYKKESNKYVDLNKSVINENTKHIVEKYEEKMVRRKKAKASVEKSSSKLEGFMI